MSKRYVLVLTAANRTGILAAVATALAELGGNIHEASQTVLQKFFTIILAADFPNDRDPQVILGHIRGVCQPFGVEVILRSPSDEPLEDDELSRTKQYFLKLTGNDAPGLIGKISGRLAREGIDIRDLYAARQESDQQFVMVLELSVPLEADISVLQRDLEQLGLREGLSATLQEHKLETGDDPRPVRRPASEADA